MKKPGELIGSYKEGTDEEKFSGMIHQDYLWLIQQLNF